MKSNETSIRSIAKTATYRILGSAVTFGIAFILTGNWVVSGAISFTEFVIKPVAYLVHERIWNKISWGKN